MKSKTKIINKEGLEYLVGTFVYVNEQQTDFIGEGLLIEFNDVDRYGIKFIK